MARVRKKAVPAKDSAPSEEATRKRAFEIWQARGGEPGRELDDWAQAEQELRGHGRFVEQPVRRGERSPKG